MDFKQIQELIKMINKSNIGEVSIEEKGFKLTIKQKEEAVQQVFASPAPVQQSYMPQPAAGAPVPQASGSVSEKSKPSAEAATDNLITIKSPMIGTFYRSPSPGKPPFYRGRR